MRTLFFLAIGIIAALVLSYTHAKAKPFYPTKPNCTTTCRTVNGQTICVTQCSGGTN